MSRTNLYLWALGSVLVVTLPVMAIDVEVATAKPNYYPGEYLEVLITVTNQATLHFGSTLQTIYTMDGVYTPGLVGDLILTSATTPRTWTNTHWWGDYNLALGIHTVVGTVIEYGTSPPATFGVVEAPTPEGDFLVDFETIPATSSRMADLMAYYACGVRFRTSQGRPCGIRHEESNSWVTGFDPYPTGFHVVADFTRPVFGARAKVAAAGGCQMTMIAKNATGQVLATAVCPPITQSGQFAQSLSVKTTEPIASLEWWPSNPRSMVGVDDLFVITTPILSQTVVGTTLRLTWPTVAGANYQLWSSTDLQTWLPWAPACVGTGGVQTNECSMASSTVRFFRVSKSD
jgi:hypothetical protein